MTTAPRWLRFLPGRPQLMLLLGLALLVFVAIIFANLAIERSTAQADFDRARDRHDQLETQNVRLQRELEQSQDGQQLAYWAYRLFGLTPPGTEVIEGQPQAPVAATSVEKASTGDQPVWVRWWEKLRRP